MSTDIKKNDKLDYVEKVMGMTDARFISEAESFRFEKRKTPVSTWIAAACFALIFAAAAILLIKPMGERPIEITHPTEEPTEAITATMSEESARGIIASLIVYHNGQFTRSAQLGNLKLSPSVAADLEKRQRCIDEAEARLGKNFSKASVTGSTTFSSFTLNGKNMTVSFTQLTKLVTGDAASDLIVITAEHTAEIAPDGTILSDFFSEDAIGFTNIPIEPAPSQAPIPYNRYEYDTLLAFFELADENGVKNGEKCFKNYDPEQVDFWGNEEQYDYNSWMSWDKNGSLTWLWLDGRKDPSTKLDGEAAEDEPILLAGELNLDGFDKLEFIRFYSFVFENLRTNDCPAIREARICTSTNETVLSGNLGSIGSLFIDSSGHCRYEHNGSKGIASEFTIDLTAQGQGKVIIDMYNGATTIGVYASPENGYEFIGWFDAEGDLISNVQSFEISYNGETGSDISDFTGTARFASSDQSELVTDPWYFEKAWEYAELVNRLYGFNFQKDDWRASSRYHNRHIYFDTSENESDPIQLAVYFSDFEKEVRTAVLRSGSYGRPANYEDLSEEEWEALVYEVMPEAPVFTVTREMLEEAGYTLDGTSADYDKIAEFIAKSKAALLTGCSDNNPWRCIEAEVDYVSPVDGDTYFDDHPELHPFSYQLFVRPSHPHAFISCNRGSYILAADDGAHPGWLLLDFNFTIADADGAWKCERPFS